MAFPMTGNPIIDQLLNPQQSVSEGVISGEQFGPPQPPPPPPQGFFDKADQFLAKPSGQFLVNLLAQQGYSRVPQSRAGAVGRAALMTRRQGIESRKASSQEDLIRAQIGLFDARAAGGGGINATGGNIQSVQKGANGNFFVFKRNSAIPIDTGVPFNENLVLLTNADGSTQFYDKSSGTPVGTPIQTTAEALTGAEASAAATETGKQGAITEAIPEQTRTRAAEDRHQDNIGKAIPASDSMAVLKRAINLLDSVKTGGIHAASLRAKQIFGVEGADEAELSANLGKAVLAQLRTTFGAQFTQQEGERLIAIEAGFGKSTEANRRLLGQAVKMVERVAERGIKSAEAVLDFDTADQIRKSMDFSLKPDPTETPQDGKRIRFDAKGNRIG